jgi:pimeloyl-ACP methyl ester carboxylesterase
VVAPDPPGHGRSPALPLDSYLPSLASLAADLLSALGIERAAFLGFS